MDRVRVDRQGPASCIVCLSGRIFAANRSKYGKKVYVGGSTTQARSTLGQSLDMGLPVPRQVGLWLFADLIIQGLPPLELVVVRLFLV
jgi:hypothetical protein